MEINQDNQPTPKYWMSLEQWRNDPEFAKLAETEFQSSPLQSGEGQDGWARREFLKLMGASLALTTFGCIRRPAQKIIPYAKKPYDIIHGHPNFYASSYVDGLEGLGILVTTRDGRPIKIEGNADHPSNQGGMSARAHAHILKLYDPDRYTSAKHCLQNKDRSNREIINITWENLDKATTEQLKKGKVALLMSTTLSPSTQALVEEFAAAYGAKVYQHDDISYGTEALGQKMSYGQEAVPHYRVDHAKCIVSINSDFLGTWLTPVAFQRQFGQGRKATAEMSKLIVFEPLMTLTGTNADQRYRIRPSQALDVVMALLNDIIVNRKQSRYANDEAVLRLLSGFAKNQAELGFSVAEIGEELWKNRGQSLVLAGGLAAGTDDALALQVAVNFLNSVLENEGKTVDGLGTPVISTKTPRLGVAELIKAMNAKEVSTLIVHGVNPVYSLPANAKFAAALAQVEMIISTSDRNDETARCADFVATDHHPMENWGDMQSYEGVLSIQQPTIRPLYDTRAFQDTLLVWIKAAGKGSARAKAANNWFEYLQSYWKDVVFAAHKGRTSGSFVDFWETLLQSGVHLTGKSEGGSRSFASSALNVIKAGERKSGFELALYSTVGVGDGALANVPWLMEFPDPISKIVWDNYASFSPKDAQQLKVSEGQVVKLTVADVSVEIPAHIQPGQADGVVGVAVGFGRWGAGKVADGVGVNAYKLAQWTAEGRVVTSGLSVKVEAQPQSIKLACTQGHHSMEGRQIVVEETLADHIKNPGGNVNRAEITSMWSGHKYPGRKWSMVVDLNSCTGCGSCVIACQSENNIPTVGKTYVLQGREMHWMRIDRYYTGTPSEPGVVHQPLLCMHCDNAPCETVCPVAATVHSDEGTNDMIYNRCVGTRYCSNNCPYKVRRFNWFNYTQVEEPRNLALNPEVTQRFRGVMEKCTFCVHRIKYQESKAKIEDRKLKDGEVRTACQQSCPTHAITFGDVNDTDSAVAKVFRAPNTYALLEELNTQPAVRYGVKVRNSAQLKDPPRIKHHSGKSSEEGHHA